jgi:hypothetical protein
MTPRSTPPSRVHKPSRRALCSGGASPSYPSPPPSTARCITKRRHDLLSDEVGILVIYQWLGRKQIMREMVVVIRRLCLLITERKICARQWAPRYRGGPGKPPAHTLVVPEPGQSSGLDCHRLRYSFKRHCFGTGNVAVKPFFIYNAYFQARRVRQIIYRCHRDTVFLLAMVFCSY